MRIDEDCALEKSTDVTNRIFELLGIDMETSGGYAGWLNGRNEWHNIIIHNMNITVLIDSNQYGNNLIVQQKHKMNYKYSKYTVYSITTHLTFHDT